MRREEGVTDGLYWLALGEGEPVLVLHGGPGADHGYLLPAFATLADRFRVILYDQRGGGRSREGNPAPAVAEHIADLDHIRSALDLGDVRLVGYSWGGLLALLHALEHPELEAPLALCSPMPPVSDYRADFQRTLRERAARPEASGLTGFPRAVAGYFVDPQRALELTPFRVQARAERAVYESLGAWDFRPRLGEIDRPVLVIHGEEDPIPIRYAEETASLLPRAKLVALPHCGHVPYIEASGPFFDALRAFL